MPNKTMLMTALTVVAVLAIYRKFAPQLGLPAA